jgi:hypothetical protein
LYTAVAVAATSLSPFGERVFAQAQPGRMTLCLSPGAIGVKADQREAIRLAAKHGFTAVEPFPQFLAGLDDAGREGLLADLKTKKLGWGAAGLPVDFRGDDARFDQGLAELPRLAAALQRCGAARVGTWISPGHNTRDYAANFERHHQRLAKVAQILKKKAAWVWNMWGPSSNPSAFVHYNLSGARTSSLPSARQCGAGAG